MVLLFALGFLLSFFYFESFPSLKIVGLSFSLFTAYFIKPYFKPYFFKYKLINLFAFYFIFGILSFPFFSSVYFLYHYFISFLFFAALSYEPKNELQISNTFFNQNAFFWDESKPELSIKNLVKSSNSKKAKKWNVLFHLPNFANILKASFKASAVFINKFRINDFLGVKSEDKDSKFYLFPYLPKKLDSEFVLFVEYFNYKKIKDINIKNKIVIIPSVLKKKDLFKLSFGFSKFLFPFSENSWVGYNLDELCYLVKGLPGEKICILKKPVKNSFLIQSFWKLTFGNSQAYNIYSGKNTSFLGAEIEADYFYDLDKNFKMIYQYCKVFCL